VQNVWLREMPFLRKSSFPEKTVNLFFIFNAWIVNYIFGNILLLNSKEFEAASAQKLERSLLDDL